MILPQDVEDLSGEDEDDEDEDRSDYQWCMYYKRVEHRMVGEISMCPYPGCNGDIFMDG